MNNSSKLSVKTAIYFHILKAGAKYLYFAAISDFMADMLGSFAAEHHFSGCAFSKMLHKIIKKKERLNREIKRCEPQ
jgi:hypothetical protein